MEHAVSELLIDRIDAFLGHPSTDPHGDPIPQSDGTLSPSASRTLADCGVGESFELARVLDQTPEFLRYLSATGLPLGARGQVVAQQPEAGTLTIQVAEAEVTTTLGRLVAEKLLVL